MPHGAEPAPPGAGRTAGQNALEAERTAATAAISALSRDFDGIIDGAYAVATDDEHDPEGATIAFERAQVAALLERARRRLADVDLALARIAEGSYGGCERCGEPISAGRLAARPAARTCIRCAAVAG
jgi:DnaK suppressor protein